MESQDWTNVAGELTQFQQAGVNVLRSRYADPHLDIASRYLPRNLKNIWNLCLYYSLMNPIVAAIIQKLSTYIVTTPIYNTHDSKLEDFYKSLLEQQLNIRSFVAGFNVDYNTYGIAYASVIYPFTKVFICPKCGHYHNAEKTNFKIRNFKPTLTCTKCKREVEAIAKDIPIKRPEYLRVIRWNPQYIIVEENPITNDVNYYLNIPVNMYNSFQLRRSTYATTPQQVIEVAAAKKVLKFAKDAIFVSKREGPSNTFYKGYGIPLIMPVLKDVYLMQIARKAQESILYEHILPIRIAFPMQGEALAQQVPLKTVIESVQEQLRGWRIDQNRILIFPIPITIQEFGGRGKMLFLAPEMQYMAQTIAAGCLVPYEFVFGGLTWSGSSISLRVLDNYLLYNIHENNKLLKFIADKISDFCEVKNINIQFKPFKMADDIQRISLLNGLNARNLVSASTLLQTIDLNFDNEVKKLSEEVPKLGTIMKEQVVGQAKAQSEGQKIQAKTGLLLQALQQQAQQAMQEQMQQQQQPMSMAESPTQPGMMGADVTDLATYQAQKLQQMDEGTRQRAIEALYQHAPGFAQQVMERLQAMMQGEQPENEIPEDLSEMISMQALPEQKPPRRENSPI